MLMDHYDLTAWLFWLILAILFVCVLNLCCQLRNPRKQEKEKEKEEKPRKPSCKGEIQYFGFLRDWKGAPPENCQKCEFILECRDEGKEKQMRGKVVTKDCVNEKGQYLGFLKEKSEKLKKNFDISANCVTCDTLVKCRGLASRSLTEKWLKKIGG